MHGIDEVTVDGLRDLQRPVIVQVEVAWSYMVQCSRRIVDETVICSRVTEINVRHAKTPCLRASGCSGLLHATGRNRLQEPGSKQHRNRQQHSDNVPGSDGSAG